MVNNWPKLVALLSLVNKYKIYVVLDDRFIFNIIVKINLNSVKPQKLRCESL